MFRLERKSLALDLLFFLSVWTSGKVLENSAATLGSKRIRASKRNFFCFMVSQRTLKQTKQWFYFEQKKKRINYQQAARSVFLGCKSMHVLFINSCSTSGSPRTVGQYKIEISWESYSRFSGSCCLFDWWVSSYFIWWDLKVKKVWHIKNSSSSFLNQLYFVYFQLKHMIVL